MKKILVFVVSFLCLPIIALAKVDDPDYTIKALYVNADILDNGNMLVKELFVLKGDFNGYIRELYKNNDKLTSNGKINFEHDAIYNPNGFKFIKTSAKKISDYSFDSVLGSFDSFKKVNNDSTGSKDVFEQFLTSKQMNIKTYYSCYNCQVGFYYEYEVSDIIVNHTDVSELYYQFIGDAFTDNINKVEIRVNLPEKDISDKFRVWAHGNLQGEVYFNDNKNGVIAKIDKLKAKNTVDIRLTFDNSLLQSSLKNSGVEALPSILKIEEKRAEDANKERERIKRIYYGMFYASIIYMIILIIYFIYIALKYDKEYKTDFDHEYNREFIEDYDVEVIDYLMTKSITPNAMSASIMNLIYKKKIKASEVGKNDYELEIISKEGLSISEEKLVEFLFDKVGDGQKFTLNQLKKYAKSTKTYSKFTSSYEAWKNMVISVGKNEKFFEEYQGVRVKGILYGVLGIAISIVSFIEIEEFAISHLVIIPAILFIVYVCCFRKKTLKGINHYKRWKAFKKFLNDFGSFDEKELPEVALWEKYLVYAVIFGLASKVQNAMNVKISEMEEAGRIDSVFDPLYFRMNLNMSHIINSSVSTAINNAVSAAVANSASASGSGRGGGFSSGGGFGGGGGGGHGF